MDLFISLNNIYIFNDFLCNSKNKNLLETKFKRKRKKWKKETYKQNSSSKKFRGFDKKRSWRKKSGILATLFYIFSKQIIYSSCEESRQASGL